MHHPKTDLDDAAPRRPAYARGRYSLERIEEEIERTSAELKEFERARGKLDGASLRRTAASYQELCNIYGYLATFYPRTTLTQKALRAVYHGRRLIYGNRLAILDVTESSFLRRVPQSYRIIKNYAMFATLCFFLSGIIALLMVQVNPEVGWAFLSEEAVAGLRSGRLWTEQIKGFSSIASSKIATNNISVSFLAFASGITGGIGTMLLLVMNGAMLGGVFGVVGRFNLSGELLDFIVAHGVLELSVIAVAAGCGFYIGDAIIHPGFMSRKESLQRAARPALDVVLFSAICLVPAGLVEGYISPYDTIPFQAKCVLGLFMGICYWTYLITGRLLPSLALSSRKD